MNRAIFLDRDGVLNEVVMRNGKPYSPAGLDELKVVADAASALAKLKARGFLLIVVTNQPDIARGLAPVSLIDALNARVTSGLPIDAVEMCPHDDNDGCNCRKPKPGMLLRAAERDDIDLSNSFMIGDRWRDIEAGRQTGCRTLLIGDGYSEKELNDPKRKPDVTLQSLTGAAEWILSQCA